MLSELHRKRTASQDLGISPPPTYKTKEYTFFNHAQKFPATIIENNTENKIRCIELIDRGEYSQVIPIAMRIPCILLQHGIINRLILKGAYLAAAEISEQTPSDLIKQDTVQKLMENRAYYPASIVAASIKDVDIKEQSSCLLEIEEGYSIEFLEEKISKISSDNIKHNLSMALLKKCGPETITGILESLRRIFSTYHTEPSDEMRHSMILLLLEKKAPDFADIIASPIKNNHLRFFMKLLIAIEKGLNIDKFLSHIPFLSCDEIYTTCLSLIEKGRYNDAAIVAKLFPPKSRKESSTEWRRCDVFLHLIDIQADQEAVQLLPFQEFENIRLVYNDLMRKRKAALDSENPTSDPVSRLNALAQQLQIDSPQISANIQEMLNEKILEQWPRKQDEL